MWCPRCEQGSLVKAKVKESGVCIYLCEECEATWFSLEQIGVGEFIDFGVYMRSVGLPPLWTSIEILHGCDAD